MTHHSPVSREELQALANQPIGSRALQEEAERLNTAHGGKASAELKAVCKRAAKKWLPAGRKAVTREGQQEAEKAFYANQLDIEDAVERRGGVRGGMGQPGKAPRSPLLTVRKRKREFDVLYRGEYAMANCDGYSIFNRKRDAEAYADFLSELFGERLETMGVDPTVRPTPDERDAMRTELHRLKGTAA